MVAILCAKFRIRLPFTVSSSARASLKRFPARRAGLDPLPPRSTQGPRAIVLSPGHVVNHAGTHPKETSHA